MPESIAMRLLLIGSPVVMLILLSVGPAVAQVDTPTDAENAPTGEPASEVVVIGKRPDDQEQADQLYADMLRQQMYDEVERMRTEETIAWRETDMTYKTSEDSRMTFGYDPVEERNLRELTDINEMPGQTVRPATLFRAKF